MRSREELLVSQFGGSRLKHELDRVPLWRGDTVKLKQLIEDFGQYLYLPRLRNPNVLIGAAQEGPTLLTWQTDSFAYAERWDTAKSRYVGLQAGRVVRVNLDSDCMLVKPDVALRQMEADATAATSQGLAPGQSQTTGSLPFVVTNGSAGVVPTAAHADSKPTRFHASVELDPTRMGRDAGKIAEEVVHHLQKQPGAKVGITLEIQAEVPDGAPDEVVRTVTENAKTLKFRSLGFEKD